MIIRSRAPLRLGLAGGGTDVSPYSDIYGGAILNATINLFAYASIIPRNDGQIVLNAIDRGEKFEYKSIEELPLDGNLDLLKGIYNRVVKNFTKRSLSFELTTIVDAPAGSGLGSSSTLVTAIVGAFAEWLKIPLGEYDIAQLAYQIERIDLGYAGGKQDQYAATFGGVNFMEFYDHGKVIVNPLRIRSNVLNELAYNLVLYYTGTSRLSSTIIEKQQKSIQQKDSNPINAMHKTKEIAILIKEAILKADLNSIGEILHEGWQVKKQLAQGISNEQIDRIYEEARNAGALGGKISGAGGGGFMFFFCPGNTRFEVIKTLNKFGGQIAPFQFTKNGLSSWSI
ncbi:MAG: GHMP kinase [Prolixibacteraceae bacterium]|nr:GHMP kinase [Prolixibacteraceae bacterium]